MGPEEVFIAFIVIGLPVLLVGMVFTAGSS